MSNTVNAADKVVAQQQQAQVTAPAVLKPPLPPKPTPTISKPQAPVKAAPANGADATLSSSAPPTLKLKIGGSSKSSQPQVAAIGEPSSVPATKPKTSKTKKAKNMDMPPSLYIDDGSHDLLQEVIAMEELEQVFSFTHQTPGIKTEWT